MECDGCLVIVFYENQIGTQQGFSDIFLNALSEIGNIACLKVVAVINNTACSSLLLHKPDFCPQIWFAQVIIYINIL